MYLRSFAVVLLAASSASANDFQNPSFELGTFVPDGNNTYAMNAGNLDLTGWGIIAQMAWIGMPNPFGLAPSDGNRFLDLTSYAAFSGGVFQSVATGVGFDCHVEFDQGSYNSTGNSFLHVIASDSQGIVGSAVFTEIATGVARWDRHTLDFVAREANTTITFIHDFGGGNYTGLDNVSFTQVAPAPASLSLIGLAGLIRRRR